LKDILYEEDDWHCILSKKNLGCSGILTIDSDASSLPTELYSTEYSSVGRELASESIGLWFKSLNNPKKRKIFYLLKLLD